MKIDELKEECLLKKQLQDAEHKAGNFAGESYHRGRMQVWLSIHETLVVLPSWLKSDGFDRKTIINNKS